MSRFTVGMISTSMWPRQYKDFKIIKTQFVISVAFFIMVQQPQWAKGSSLSRIHDHTQHTALGRTPLGEWSACRR
jgi:hypothetical protein